MKEYTPLVMNKEEFHQTMFNFLVENLTLEIESGYSNEKTAYLHLTNPLTGKKVDISYGGIEFEKGDYEQRYY